MKKFIQFIAAIKTMASFAFTGGIMLVTVGFMFFGKQAIPVGIIWQVIFLALIYSVFQFLAFSDSIFPHMGTPGRITLLGISMLAALAAFAFVFGWFPINSIVNWLIFLGLYLAVFSIAAIALRIVFHMGGMKYNELLNAYKARRDY